MSQPSPNFRLLNEELANLTTCEWKLLIQLASDLTNAEIADTLCLTPKSVQNYVNRVGGKLNLRGHHKLAKFARQYSVELTCWHNTLVDMPLSSHPEKSDR